MQVKSIADCSKGSILQYFRPTLGYHLLLRSLFCLFLSGRFTQVLLYVYGVPKKIEMVLSGTNNKCFGLEIRKIIFNYAHLSRDLV